MKAKIVEKPAGMSRGGPALKYPYPLILKAFTAGKAARLELNGTRGRSAYWAIRNYLGQRGWRAHAHIEKRTITVWGTRLK